MPILVNADYTFIYYESLDCLAGRVNKLAERSSDGFRRKQASLRWVLLGFLFLFGKLKMKVE